MTKLNRAVRYAIELKPNGFGYHYQLGDVLNAQGKLEAALDEFKTEVNNNPRYIKARMEVADLEARIAAGIPVERLNSKLSLRPSLSKEEL